MLRRCLPIAFVLVAMPAWTQVQQVEVVATSPLPGQGMDRNLLPYMTQVMRRHTIEATQADTTTDLLARRAAGVQVSDIQGSPYQSELSFRGYRASGLLGAAQGLSVYLDGVRINEPFGDVVSWDLVPEFALDSIALVPGANPAFGLNTLGGAISLNTLDGRHARGLRAEIDAGSFGRRRLNLTHGGADSDGDHFIGFGLFGEDGWREHSAGRLGTLFAKLGVQTDAGRWSLSALAGHSRLVGNGLVPCVSLDDEGRRTPDLAWMNRRAVYTHPDRTTQQLAQLSGSWRWAMSGDETLEALAYARRTRRDTLNGDQAEVPVDGANASINRGRASQSAIGASLGWSGRMGGHQWQFGASVDQARVRYRQTEQAGRFTADRGVQPLDAAVVPDVAVQGRHVGWGMHASDTVRVADATHVTATLRFNEARPASRLTHFDEDDGTAVDSPEERFRYRSWNPAIGIAQRAGPTLTLFANIARNTRAPTVIELGCADAAQACRLPAGLQSDPYLKPVRSTTLEAGLRFGREGDHGGSLTFYRNDNHDDIVFASVSVSGNLGYFRNVPLTRHQGLDSEWHGGAGAWRWSAGYSLLDASYRFAGVLRQGERNVQVTPGTPIAGVSRHHLRLTLDWRAVDALSLGGDLQASSRRGVAGNEDGRLADGSAHRVDLSLPGPVVLNLRAGWQPVPGWDWSARIGNALDRRGASHGALTQTLFDAQGRYDGQGRDALFIAPQTPRSLTIGLRLAL